ncbi:N-acetylmuramoyl-L-alanine amidase [Roseibium aggregatum]|uniref:N-acetylmuramoyl-L-alanine amidase n=1 Tax=Roseibium aggregatum TaxID=187304 RepID=A0A926P6D9_9HYPH|nr:N-acetylmuramoyl-L-alanine amidase [Roseibium aggregatum]MBD1549311.1 N-acetylmuramoyl-L-alanine amidase [Roseibium aggregatum]
MFAFALAFAQVPSPARAAAENENLVHVSGARIAGDEDRTRFVLDLDQQLSPVISALADPYRLIIDLPEITFDLPADTGREGRGLIKAWRYGLFAKGKSRIVLDVSEPVAIDKTFVLPAVDDQPARMVIDIVKTSREGFLKFVQSSSAKPVRTANREEGGKGDRLAKADLRDKPLIMLDPGHGGIDTGAIGVAGTLEKAVVLEFSDILKRKLEETGRYTVRMTRDDDTFIPLGERVEIGHRQQADLFISVHADSVVRGRSLARGATVYTLSDRASDQLAQEIAESENMSDVIAGVQLEDEPADVADILIDLARRETRNFSVFFARSLVSELKSAVRLIHNPHRSAGFRVLKANDVPSVLVELGYLSNSHDEKLLISDEWRERMADAMVEAVDTFFRPRLAQDRSRESDKVSQ